MRRHRLLGLRQHARIRFLHHLLAKIHAHQVVLENIVVEHVFRRFTEVHNPFGDGRRTDPERHVLRVRRAGRVVVAANTANPAGDEVRVPRILALHENTVAAKDGRSAVAFRHRAILKIDLRKNPQASHDPGDRIPVHVHQVSRLRRRFFAHPGNCAHFLGSFFNMPAGGSPWSARHRGAATSVPCSPSHSSSNAKL